MNVRRAGLAGAALSCALLLVPQVWSQDTDRDAQNWSAPRGYDMAYPENGRPNMVARQGYAAGFNQGRDDAAHGKKFTPTENKAYGKAVIPAGMNKDEFKQEYREAFVKGYDAGYKGQ
jgi:hypothetical protein